MFEIYDLCLPASLLALSYLWFSSLPLPFLMAFVLNTFQLNIVWVFLLFLLLCLTVLTHIYQHLQLSAQSGSWRVRIKFFLFFYFLNVCVPPSTFILFTYWHYRELTPGYPSSLVVDLFCLSLDSGWQEFTIVQLQPQFRQILICPASWGAKRRIFSAFSPMS